MKVSWQGKGINEIGLCKNKTIIKVDERYFRPTEVETLLGDAAKAKIKLNWEPKISFKQLVAEMTLKDLELAEQEKLMETHGYNIRKPES